MQKEDIQDDTELAAYGLIAPCSVEEAEENYRVLLKESEANAKENQDGEAGWFHKNFLMFLDRAKDTLERIPIRQNHILRCGSNLDIRWEESHRGRCRFLPKGRRRFGGPFSATCF
jgi:hypothetical protein